MNTLVPGAFFPLDGRWTAAGAERHNRRDDRRLLRMERIYRELTHYQVGWNDALARQRRQIQGLGDWTEGDLRQERAEDRRERHEDRREVPYDRRSRWAKTRRRKKENRKEAYSSASCGFCSAVEGT